MTGLLNEIAADIAAANAEVVAEVKGVKVTRGELNAAFELVKPVPNWKYPINAVVAIREPFEGELIRAAIEFYTGSVASIKPYHERGKYVVTAAGYYAAIGA